MFHTRSVSQARLRGRKKAFLPATFRGTYAHENSPSRSRTKGFVSEGGFWASESQEVGGDAESTLQVSCGDTAADFEAAAGCCARIHSQGVLTDSSLSYSGRLHSFQQARSSIHSFIFNFYCLPYDFLVDDLYSEMLTRNLSTCLALPAF